MRSCQPWCVATCSSLLQTCEAMFVLLRLDMSLSGLHEASSGSEQACQTAGDAPCNASVCRESLELVGVHPERVHAELAAQELLKQQRLYAGAATAAAARGAPEPDSNSEAAVVSSMLCGGGCAPLDGVADAPQSQRGSEQWLQAQREFEDAHLGQFERILPPADSTTVRWLGCTVRALPVALRRTHVEESPRHILATMRRACTLQHHGRQRLYQCSAPLHACLAGGAVRAAAGGCAAGFPPIHHGGAQPAEAE